MKLMQILFYSVTYCMELCTVATMLNLKNKINILSTKNFFRHIYVQECVSIEGPTPTCRLKVKPWPSDDLDLGLIRSLDLSKSK